MISTKGTRFMAGDIKNLYLMSLLRQKEHTKPKLADISQEVVSKYKLRNKVVVGERECIDVNKGMYGLPQTALLEQEILVERLAAYVKFKMQDGPWFVAPHENTNCIHSGVGLE